MKKPIRQSVFFLIIFAFISSYIPVFAADGKELYVKLTCFACHGPDGKGMVRKRDRKDKKTGEFKYRKGDPMPGFEAYPKLAGQNSVYLYNQIKDIFGGKRSNGLTSAMLGIKAFIDSSASDEDLKAIAEYLSQVK
ncbi:MAG: c-type cytochrome [SAR324 cluster bacterium]|nr:c-type cytochrome [SAR324 cluster bacterium]